MNKIMNVEKEVEECYSFFQQNHKEVKLDKFEGMLKKLKKSIVQLTVTNLINVIDRVVEDGTVTTDGFRRQYNVNSIQIASDDTIMLITYEVIGFDDKDKRYILDKELIYIPYKNVLRLF